MDEDAAAAASAAPLRGGGIQVREAREWRENEFGEDATYREAVTWWVTEIRPAINVAHHPDADSYERLGRLLRGWGKPGGAADVIRNHIGSARRRHRATIIADVTRITDAFDGAVGMYGALTPTSAPDEFTPLLDALIDLNKAVYKAYGDQPIEADAWAAGNATRDAYVKQAH